MKKIVQRLIFLNNCRRYEKQVFCLLQNNLHICCTRNDTCKMTGHTLRFVYLFTQKQIKTVQNGLFLNMQLLVAEIVFRGRI